MSEGTFLDLFAKLVFLAGYLLSRWRAVLSVFGATSIGLVLRFSVSELYHVGCSQSVKSCLPHPPFPYLSLPTLSLSGVIVSCTLSVVIDTAFLCV